jgi:hypothetical protein
MVIVNTCTEYFLFQGSSCINDKRKGIKKVLNTGDICNNYIKSGKQGMLLSGGCCPE